MNTISATAISLPNIAFAKLSQGNTVFGNCEADFAKK
jgi:hypothetical protein